MARMFFATMKNNLRKEIAFFSEYFTLEKKCYQNKINVL